MLLDCLNLHLQEPCGYGHQLPLARVPESPDVWYVVDAAFGSPSPLGPVALEEVADDDLSGAMQHLVFIIVTCFSDPEDQAHCSSISMMSSRSTYYLQEHF